MRTFKTVLLTLLLILSFGTASAGDSLIEISTRDNATVGYWWMPRDGATATVILFSGGAGGINFKNGGPKSGNFLIRSRDEFAKSPFNVALFDNPSDERAMTHAFRLSKEHQADVLAVVNDIKKRSSAPIWLVGTSQGTLSAAANGVALGKEIAGVILTSSVTGSQQGGSVVDVELEKIQVPVLIVSHKQDACRLTPPDASKALLTRVGSSPVRKYIELDGGSGASGNPCEAFHYHGFIGMEAEAVSRISDWVKQPVN